MNKNDIENTINETLMAWDNVQPAEISPFVWTRIQASLFEEEKQKPSVNWALKMSIAIWAILILINGSVWLTNKNSNMAGDIRNAYFSENDPYSF